MSEDNQSCWSIEKLFAASTKRKQMPTCNPVTPLPDNILKRDKCLVHQKSHISVFIELYSQ